MNATEPIRLDTSPPRSGSCGRPPLTTESRKTFPEVSEPTRLAYNSLIDFVPDKDPNEHLTVVELTPADDGIRVVMTVEPLHDQVWTERLIAGRSNELDNLAKIIAERNQAWR